MSKIILIWAAANIFQIVALFLLAHRKRLFATSPDKNMVSMADDYFFITWNIFCSLIFIYFSYLLSLQPSLLLAKVFSPSGGEVSEFTWLYRYMKAIDARNIEYAFYILVVYLGVVTQYNNRGRETKYWWDISLCVYCWFTRLFFLAVNIFFVAYVSWVVAIFFMDVAINASFASVKLSILDSDKFAGLGAFGHVMAVSVSIFVLRAILGIIGMADHLRDRKVDFLYIFGDLYNIAYGIAALVVFWLFVSVTSAEISSVKTDILTRINSACGLDLFEKSLSLSCDSRLFGLRDSVSSVSSFPFSTQDAGFIVIAWLLPIALKIYFRVIERGT